MHFRILKMIATSDFITALECTKFVFDRGSAPNPAEGAYSAPPDSLAGLLGDLLLRGWKGGERRKRGEEGGKERGRKEGEGPVPLMQIPGSALDRCQQPAWRLPARSSAQIQRLIGARCRGNSISLSGVRTTHDGVNNDQRMMLIMSVGGNL